MIKQKYDQEDGDESILPPCSLQIDFFFPENTNYVECFY